MYQVKHCLNRFFVVFIALFTLCLFSCSDNGTDSNETPGLIVFESIPHGGSASDIFIISDDGSGLTSIPNPLGLERKEPCWSPDGTRIAFAGRTENGDWEIYIMDADGTNMTQVTDNENYINDFDPCWSPDGQKIAFTTDFFSSEYHDIAIINADGSGLNRIASTFEIDSSPSWSPDGEHITYHSKVEEGNYQIAVVDTNGSNEITLTNTIIGIGGNKFPVWSPDGTRIAFASWRLGMGQIFIMNADGSEQTVLTNDVNAYTPCWSPDGSKIAYITGNAMETGADIKIMNADGSNKSTVYLGDGVWCTHPSWTAPPAD